MKIVEILFAGTGTLPQKCAQDSIFVLLKALDAVRIGSSHVNSSADHSVAMALEGGADVITSLEKALGLVLGLEATKCLEFAAAAGAIAVSRMGAEPSLPSAAEVSAFGR